MRLIATLFLLILGGQVELKAILSDLPKPVDLVVNKHLPSTGADPAKDPILVSHGLFSRKEDWTDIPQLLADQTKRTVYMFDTRDHGESPWTNEFSFPAMVADIVSFLNKHNISRVVPVGHYFAGVTFSKMATLYPQLVSSLVLVDLVPHKELPEPNRVTVLLAALNEATETLRKENFTGLEQAKQRAEVVMSATVKEPHVRRYLLDKLIKRGDKIDWQFNLAQITKDWKKNQCGFHEPMPTYNGPTLEIAGGQSMFIREEDHPSILERFPNAKFVTFADANHAVPFTHKNQFVSEVVSFVENDFRSVTSGNQTS